jgi:omega-amidase
LFQIWNSPYATAAFPEYAEALPDIGDTHSDSASATLLFDAAREHNMWIVGGSIPEIVEEDGQENIYNTCLVLNPEGEVVAKHRKVHLFDVDVPGGIKFLESETLTPGETVSHFSTPFGEIGVGLCYDIRFAEYAMLLRQKHNCVALIYPGAFNLTTGVRCLRILNLAFDFRELTLSCYSALVYFSLHTGNCYKELERWITNAMS